MQSKLVSQDPDIVQFISNSDIDVFIVRLALASEKQVPKLVYNVFGQSTNGTPQFPLIASNSTTEPFSKPIFVTSL